MKKIFAKLKRWYYGESRPYDSDALVVGIITEYSFSTKVTRWFVKHWLEHWKFWITILVAVSSSFALWLKYIPSMSEVETKVGPPNTSPAAETQKSSTPSEQISDPPLLEEAADSPPVDESRDFESEVEKESTPPTTKPENKTVQDDTLRSGSSFLNSEFNLRSGSPDL